MSIDSVRTRLADFIVEEPEQEEEIETKEAEKPNWNPHPEEEYDSGNLAKCDQCGGTVSADFVRVFGDNDGVLRNGCRNCSEYREYTGLTGFGSAEDVL